MNFKRMDICFFLDALGDTSKNIWELTIPEQKELVYYLDRKSVCRHGWKMFADELEYSASEIERFNSSFRHFERPTILLFNILISKYPKMELQEISSACEKANRNDVAKMIGTVQTRIIDCKAESHQYGI